ncbi:MAG: hypothetical protein WAK93_19530, partial [Solirubrobacteraceae bacterium]
LAGRSASAMLVGGLVRRRAVWLRLLGGAGAALAIAGCGTAASSGSSGAIAGTTLTIYASRPAGAGSQTSTDVLDAEKLAFEAATHKAGKYTLVFRAIHGSELSDNARTAIQDKTAIAYLGELAPGTSGVSVQINNEQGLLQVSPVDTAVYLTQPTPAVPGAPKSYYPSNSTYHDTFARVVPTTAAEAKALVAEMHALKLSKLYVSDDGTPYGASTALEVRQDAPSQGLTIVSSPQTADAVFYGGLPGTDAAHALDQAASTSPSARLFAPSALYDQAFVAGLTPAAQRNLYVSSPGFTTKELSPAGQQFVTKFTSTFGRAPVPQAIFGYEAMSAVLAVLDQAGANAGDRSDVVSDFRTLKNRQSVLGTYSIVGGDTNIAPFIFARPQGGRLVARPPA